jgi:hypothetical protein
MYGLCEAVSDACCFVYLSDLVILILKAGSAMALSFLFPVIVDILPPTKLLNNSKKLNIWFRYLARTLVGRQISGGADRETPGYRQEWSESVKSKSVDN